MKTYNLGDIVFFTNLGKKMLGMVVDINDNDGFCIYSVITGNGDKYRMFTFNINEKVI